MKDYIVTEIHRGEAVFTAAAFYEDKTLSRLEIQRKEEPSRVGMIINGVAEKLLPNIDGAFVKISDKDQAFLPTGGEKISGSAKFPVLITKESHDRKQCTCTRAIALSGRTCVVTCGKSGLLFSRKLTGAEKAALKAGLAPELYKDFQVLIRTNAKEEDISLVIEEIRALEEELKAILAVSKKEHGCAVLYRPPVFYERLLRDLPSVPDRIRSDIPLIAQRLGGELYTDPVLSLGDLKSLNSEIDKLLGRKINLKSGAFLVIEQTEAFVSIDVNTGKCRKGKDAEATYFAINKEALPEIMRQLTLRNLSGMILVDLISLRDRETEKLLLEEARKAALADPLHTEVIDITPLGILELVRQKKEKPLGEILK